MDMLIPEKWRRPTIVLSRCPCAFCQLGEDEAREIARRHGVALQINRFAAEDCCGLSACRPVFYVAGAEVTRGAVEPGVWEAAVRRRLPGVERAA